MPERSSTLGAVWFYGALVICVLLVVDTLFRYQLAAQTGILSVLTTFNLARENDVAVWWSGMLLLITAFHAFDGYVLRSGVDSKAARAWTCLSILLVGLSIDEVASLHERVQMIPGFSSKWYALLPFAMVFAAIAVYAIVNLRRSETDADKAGLVAAAMLIFVLVGLMEFVEHEVTWRNELVRVARGAVEEGSELTAILLLLAVTMRNTHCFNSRDASSRAPVFEFVRLATVPAVMTLALAIPVIAFISSRLPDQHRGHPADWVAAACFLIAAISIARGALQRRKRPARSDSLLILLLLLASISCVAVDPARMSLEKAGIGAGTRLLLLSGIYICVCLCLMRRHARLRVEQIVVMWLTLVILVASNLAGGLFMTYFTAQVSALASMWLVAPSSDDVRQWQPVHRVAE